MPKTKAEKANQNQSTATSASSCAQALEVTPRAIPSIATTNVHRNWSWSDFLDSSDSDMDMDHEVKSEGLDEHNDAATSDTIVIAEKVEPKQMNESKDRRIVDDLSGGDGKTYFTSKAEQSAQKKNKKLKKKLKKLRREEKLDAANAHKTEMRNKIPKLSKSLTSQDNHRKQTIPKIDTTIQATVSPCNKTPVAPVSQDFIIDSGAPSMTSSSLSSKVHSNNIAVDPAGDEDDVKIVYSSFDSWRPWVVEMGSASSIQAPAVGTSEFAFEEFAQQEASSAQLAGPSQVSSVAYAHPQTTPVPFVVDNILQPSFGQAAITARNQEFYKSWNPNPFPSSITSDASHVQNDPPNNTATITDAPVPSPTLSLISDAGSHSTQSSSSVTTSGNGFADRRGSRGSRKRLPEESVRKLKEYYQDQKYVTDYKELAATAGLTPTQVRVWFQNRRVQDRITRRQSRKVLSGETLDALEEPAKKTSRMKTNTPKQLKGVSKSNPSLENSAPSQSWQPQILTPPVTPVPSSTSALITPASATSSVPPQSHPSTSSHQVANEGASSAQAMPPTPATIKVFSLSRGPQAPFSPKDYYPPTVHKWTPSTSGSGQQVFLAPAPSPSSNVVIKHHLILAPTPRTSRQKPMTEKSAPIPDPKPQDKKKDNNKNSKDEDVVEIDPLAMDDYFLPKNCITL